MKKEIFSIAAWLLAFAAPLALLTACDDDDDSDDGSSYTTDGGESGTQLANIPAVVDASGVSCFIETISGTDIYPGPTITYDSNNLIETLGDWTISYSPFKIVEYEDEEGSYILGNFSFNSDGYITKLTSILEDYVDEDESWVDKITYTYSYNSDGHLSNFSVKMYEEISYNEDGDTWSETYSWTGSVEFTWDGDYCTKMTMSESGSGDGFSDKNSVTVTFTYDDDIDCKQTLYDSYAYFFFEEPVLLCLGYFGAPGYLPATASLSGTETENWYGEKSTVDYNYEYTYTYETDNGKVYYSKSKEKYSYESEYDGEEYSGSSSDTYTYNYTYVGDSSSKSLSTKSASLTEQPDETQVSSKHRPRTMMSKIRERRQSHRNQSQTEE